MIPRYSVFSIIFVRKCRTWNNFKIIHFLVSSIREQKSILVKLSKIKDKTLSPWSHCRVRRSRGRKRAPYNECCTVVSRRGWLWTGDWSPKCESRWKLAGNFNGSQWVHSFPLDRCTKCAGNKTADDIQEIHLPFNRNMYMGFASKKPFTFYL